MKQHKLKAIDRNLLKLGEMLSRAGYKLAGSGTDKGIVTVHQNNMSGSSAGSFVLTADAVGCMNVTADVRAILEEYETKREK